MSEPNYEYIGRCVVLNQRIESNIKELFRIKNSITISASPVMTGNELAVEPKTLALIENAASQYRELLEEIGRLVAEHNEYAPSAGLKAIEYKQCQH